MNRWLASRWLVVGFLLCCGAFALDWYRDADTFASVAMAFFGLGGVKQWRDVHRRQIGEEPLAHLSSGTESMEGQ